MKLPIWVLWMAVALVRPLHGAGLIVVDEAHWSPPDHPSPPHIPAPPRPWPPHVRPRPYTPLELTRYQASVTLTDQVAVTTVEQEFFNPNDRRLEGSFLLPVPRDAQLRKFTLEINGKPVEAELLKADQARAIYEDIVRKLKDPALLEYAGQDVYKVRIFPIEPRERKRVSYTYTEVLRADAGLIAYRHTLSTTKFSAKPPENVTFTLQVTTTQPLKTIYSPTHDADIRRDGARRATVGFEARNPSSLTDFQLYFAAEREELGLNLMTHRTHGDDGHFLLLLSPGLDSNGAKTLPKDVAFVLDTSGSMAGAKLEQAKKALAFCVENLNTDDRFEIVRFSTDCEGLFDRLEPASPANRHRARAFLENLKAIGGTAIDAALDRGASLRPASSDRPFVMIFLTDGLPTIGETREDSILQNLRDRIRHAGQSRIFCFGIGHDVNTHLLDKVAEASRAFSTYVLPEEDLELKLSSFYSRIKDPVLVSPTLRLLGDVRLRQLYPDPLPDLFRGDQLIVVGRFQGTGAATLVLEGQAEGKPHAQEFSVQFPPQADQHDFIPRLWATRRVGYLLDAIRLQGENAELRDEVAELARRYGIVTPYTAYLIVEDEARRQVPAEQQTLLHLQQNPIGRAEARDSFAASQRERYGIAAVSRARSDQVLKNASAPSQAVRAGAVEAGRAIPKPTTGPTPGAVATPTATPTDLSQLSQFVQGRTFYFNGEQWVDSRVQSARNTRTIALKVGSDAYLALQRREPRVAQWLAIGPRVQFVLGNTVYTTEP